MPGGGVETPPGASGGLAGPQTAPAANQQQEQLTAQQVAQINAIPLPAEVQQIISAGRSQFFARMGEAWEESIKGLVFVLKVQQLQAAQQEQARLNAGAEQNRAEVEARRAEARAKVEQAKTAPTSAQNRAGRRAASKKKR